MAELIETECPICSGTGIYVYSSDDYETSDTCNSCNGTGIIVRVYSGEKCLGELLIK